MKKIGIMTVAVALGLLCGCTKVDNSLVPESLMSEYAMSLNVDASTLVDVSTSVGSGSTRTRGTIYNSITDLSSDGIGIYCLPARKNNKNAENPIFNQFIHYDANGDLVNANGVYWDNVKFTIGDEYTPGSGIYRLKMADDAVRPLFEYYPLASNYGYDFFAYAPYQEGSLLNANDENLDYRDQFLAVKFVIDGTQDIVHGKSVTPLDSATNPSYYSAKYFRDTQKASAVEMEFEHKLTRLNFFVKPLPATIKDVDGNEPPTDDYTGVDSLAVKSVHLVNMRDSLRMFVAVESKYSYQRGYKPGDMLAQSGTKGGATFMLHKRNDVGEWVVPDTLAHIQHKEGDKDYRIPLGEYMMVLPSSSYLMEVQLCSKNHPEIVYPKTKVRIQLPKKDNGEYNYFKAGYSYNITLSVEGTTSINFISATMHDWKTDEEFGELDVDYLNGDVSVEKPSDDDNEGGGDPDL